MDERFTTMIVVFLLFVLSGKPAEGQSLLDVCSTCHANATCDDKSDGSGKVCNCKYGFVGNGRTFCQDKDECQLGSNKICGLHTTCHNTYGSYYCTCLAGYSPSNNMAVFIPNDGTHCQDIDECRISGQCGEGAQCRNLYGSFDCSCQVGYKIHNGVEPFHPMTDKASCKVVDCGPPALVEDVKLVSATGTTYGNVATFVCVEGFVWRKGDNRSVCGAEGLWSKTNMVCEEILCGSPPVIEFTEQTWSNNSTPGSTVLYFCKEGFHNNGGNNVSICQENGQWTPPTLSCQEILCGDPLNLPHTGQVWNGSTTPGSAVIYYCKKGFYYNEGNNVSLCTINGYWTKPDISCKEIDCGEPQLFPNSIMLWDKISTLGSKVIYRCKPGYVSVGTGNISVCTTRGQWDGAPLICQEVDCGEPQLIPNSIMLWDKISTVGSKVIYQCKPGYVSVGTGNVSVCTIRGKWNGAPLICKEINCGEPVLKPHAKMLWDGMSLIGSVVHYQCEEEYYTRSLRNYSVCGENGLWEDIDLWCEAKCGPVPYLANSEVVWHNVSVVIHRCIPGYHSWRGSNISVCASSGAWQKATLICIEIKPPIHHLLIFNESCLRWKAEKYEEDTEVYKVAYTGSRDYQRYFYDKRKRFMTSKADRLELCLSLLPVTNYSITVTATSARFTATITINTSLPVPPGPGVYYREFDTPLPGLSLRRSPNTLDPISFYQVFVLPGEGIMMFNCSSPANVTHPSEVNSPAEYVTAQFDLHYVGTEMNLTIGDGLLYGGFYNAPLESGKNYYIILRAISQWKTAIKSSCVLWAKVRATSYALRVSSLSAVATIGVFAVVIWGRYSITWCFKKT